MTLYGEADASTRYRSNSGAICFLFRHGRADVTRTTDVEAGLHGAGRRQIVDRRRADDRRRVGGECVEVCTSSTPASTSPRSSTGRPRLNQDLVNRPLGAPHAESRLSFVFRFFPCGRSGGRQSGSTHRQPEESLRLNVPHSPALGQMSSGRVRLPRPPSPAPPAILADRPKRTLGDRRRESVPGQVAAMRKPTSANDISYVNE